VHIEIPTDNLEKSTQFYNSLFGWKMEPFPQFNYATWEPEEGTGGGFSPVGDDTRIGDILVHIASDDIDADLKRAQSLGVTILRDKTESRHWLVGRFRIPEQFDSIRRDPQDGANPPVQRIVLFVPPRQRRVQRISSCGRTGEGGCHSARPAWHFRFTTSIVTTSQVSRWKLSSGNPRSGLRRV
jgi:predicted enzyme related to lactoylglutathione lyase